MSTENTLARSTIWPASLGMGTVLGSFALACVFPFAAFAALAALTMTRANALMLILAVWAVNQAVGFFLLSFPWDAQAMGHGISMLVTTLIACGVARFAADRAGSNDIVRAITALVSAFIVYQLLLRGYAQFGGGAENFSAEIIRDVAVNDALWFAGLMGLRFALTRVMGEKALPAACINF